MADLRSRVQQSLSGSYTLERELGGGGMSKVFVADEHRFGRKVVVKLLSPELAAAMSATRFELYENAGDVRHATEYYGRFVDLWKSADPELQPRVVEARGRIDRMNRANR